MDKSEAFTALRKMYGAKAGYRYNKKALTAEERESLREKIPSLQSAEKAAYEARDNRKVELLKDPEYVRLAAEAKAAAEERREATGKVHSYRVTVGQNEGMFFIVTGEGDNWAEAIRKAKKS